MIKRIFLSFLFLCTSCCTLNFDVPAPKQVGNYQGFDETAAYKSVSRIFAKQVGGPNELSGSGFAVDKDRIMTAAHVCIGILEYQMKGAITNEIYMDYYSKDDQKISTMSGLKITSIDVMHDICIMTKQNHGLTPIKFANYDDVKLHSNVYIVGAPLGVFATTFSGEVIQKSLDLGRNAMGKLIVSAAAAPGNSGSAIFNERGEIVGMLVMGAGEFDHLSIGTATPDLLNFLKINGLNSK